MAAATRGELVDLPGMAGHQRAPVITVLAILMHVLARYANVNRASEESWAQAWNELIGPDALRVTAPHDEVAFLQPPTNKPTSPQSIEAADLLLPNVEHEVKRTWATARAEEAIFSLIGSLSRPNVKDHRSSTRAGLCAVLPSVDGTLGSEICSLLLAYDQLKLPTHGSTKAADHFVWLKPYRPKADAPISFADLPRPFLDIGRAQRIVQTDNDRFEIWACPNNTIRVTGPAPGVGRQPVAELAAMPSSGTFGGWSRSLPLARSRVCARGGTPRSHAPRVTVSSKPPSDNFPGG
jgi:hypothetical protein